ncbi:MAG TPA: response regulator [Sphingomicrobium sp.]
MPLKGRKILIVEDEYLIADDLAQLLQDAGAEVVGPAASLPQAMRLASDTEEIDAAALDINLRGVEVFPLADELAGRAVPMLFLTGYGHNHIPERFAHICRCEKPMEIGNVVRELHDMLEPEAAQA